MDSTLKEEIEQRAREIKTDGYPMSIGEVMSLYRDGDIDVHPEFQRIFRWRDEQKSRLIESILLGIPVPSIFVSQRQDGVWDVIDGVQRLSTIFEFLGIYRDEEGGLLPPLTLGETEYLPSLAGYRYESPVEAGSPVFDDALRRDFKRSKLEFRIVRKESDPNAKYDLFQRLNSGTELSAQEARNCLLVMLNREAYKWLVRLSEESDFTETALLSERQENEAYRQELALRFFCQQELGSSTAELNREYGEYLTDWMRESPGQWADGERTDKEEVFRRTFAVINSALGEDAFRRYDAERQRHLGPFSISAYEFITSGVGSNVDIWEDADPEALAAKVHGIWTLDAYRLNSGTGVSPRRRVPRLVNKAKQHFSKV